MKFSQLFVRGETHVEPICKKIYKTEFEQVLFSHCLSLRIFCLTDFNLTSQECYLVQSQFRIHENLRWGHTG